MSGQRAGTAAGPGPTLDLDLEPAALGQLLRGPALAALRTGQARGTRHVELWFDTAEATLAAQGLALELHPARRGARQVLRQVLPAPDQPWLPGSPGPAIAEASLGSAVPSPAAAGLAADTPLVALAACEGRRRTLTLRFEDTLLSLQVIEGKLRTVAAERPLLRLRLAGPAGAPRARLCRCAARLAADAPLLPGPPLAELARALAHGVPPRPLRQGQPLLAPTMRAEDGFVHATLHLAQVLIDLAPAMAPGPQVPAVHQFRVALRRMRSAVAVWRALVECDAVRGLDSELKALGRLAAPVRDRDVFMAGQLAEAEAALAAEGVPIAPLLALRRAIAAERAEAAGLLARHLQGNAFRTLMLGLLALAEERPWRAGAEAERLAGLDGPIAAFAAGVLARRQRKLVRQAKGEICTAAEAQGSDGANLAAVPITALHALRLSGKRLRYAAEFFAPCFGRSSAKRFLRRLSDLQEVLGHVNDGAVASQLVRAPRAAHSEAAARAWARGVVDGYAAARASEGRREAEAAWRRFRDAAPFWE